MSSAGPSLSSLTTPHLRLPIVIPFPLLVIRRPRVAARDRLDQRIQRTGETAPSAGNVITAGWIRRSSAANDDSVISDRLLVIRNPCAQSHKTKTPSRSGGRAPCPRRCADRSNPACGSGRIQDAERRFLWPLQETSVPERFPKSAFTRRSAVRRQNPYLVVRLVRRPGTAAYCPACGEKEEEIPWPIHCPSAVARPPQFSSP